VNCCTGLRISGGLRICAGWDVVPVFAGSLCRAGACFVLATNCFDSEISGSAAVANCALWRPNMPSSTKVKSLGCIRACRPASLCGWVGKISLAPIAAADGAGAGGLGTSSIAISLFTCAGLVRSDKAAEKFAAFVFDGVTRSGLSGRAAPEPEIGRDCVSGAAWSSSAAKELTPSVVTNGVRFEANAKAGNAVSRVAIAVIGGPNVARAGRTHPVRPLPRGGAGAP